MCGVIGIHIVNPSPEDIQLATNIFKNLQIRGRHASGVAYIKGKSIQGYSKSVPVDALLSEFDLADAIDPEYNEIILIGHARYSTSDLQFNQPIFGEEHAIAHNGVITQSDPSKWESEYGLIAQNSNDSSLVLAALEDGIHPLIRFPKASMAVVGLDLNTLSVTGFRNGQRPLWITNIGNGVIFSSTKDSMVRAGIEEKKIRDCFPSNIYHTLIGSNGNVMSKNGYPAGLGNDLQIDIQIKPYKIDNFKGGSSD